MIFPSNRVRILVATTPVDFRKGHDGLAAMVCQWQLKFPQFGQSKIPQFCGVRLSAVFSDLRLHFLVGGRGALGRAAV